MSTSDALDSSTRESGRDTSTPPRGPSTPSLRAFWPRVPNYELLEELGKGGMGVVFKARRLATGELVALKLIRDDILGSDKRKARFQIELISVSVLSHPNIVALVEHGENEGVPFLALELVEGGTLAQRLTGQPLSPAVAATLLEMLARALHHAHLHNIVHRDLKPLNILLTAGRNPSPKVTDFGLAKFLHLKGPTQTDAVFGTPEYMAPEQAKGQNKLVSPATDVYSLGVILYECLTGQPPFRGSTPLVTLGKVLSRRPVRPRKIAPHVPATLQAICLKCLRKKPANRYRNGGELADDLRRYLNNHTPLACRPDGDDTERLADATRITQ